MRDSDRVRAGFCQSRRRRPRGTWPRHPGGSESLGRSLRPAPVV